MKELKIKSLKPNKNNPRVIRDEKFDKLKESIIDFPQMMELRPIVLDEKNVVIGGNMRLKACTDLGWEVVPTIVFGLKEWEKGENKVPIDKRKSYKERCEEFVIKDNSGFGEWDWDVLANTYDTKELDYWGVDVWQAEDIDYEPSLSPTTDYSDVTREEIEREAKKLADEMIKEMKNVSVMCPECNAEFDVQV